MTEAQQYNLQIVKFFVAKSNYNLLLLKFKPLAVLHPNNFLKPSPDMTFSLFVLPFWMRKKVVMEMLTAIAQYKHTKIMANGT